MKQHKNIREFERHRKECLSRYNLYLFIIVIFFFLLVGREGIHNSRNKGTHTHPQKKSRRNTYAPIRFATDGAGFFFLLFRNRTTSFSWRDDLFSRKTLETSIVFFSRRVTSFHTLLYVWIGRLPPFHPLQKT